MLTIEQKLDRLREGDLVRIDYRLQAANYHWYNLWTVAVFLEDVKTDAEHTLYLSYRPKYGTVPIPVQSITDVHIVTLNRDRKEQDRREGKGIITPKRIKTS